MGTIQMHRDDLPGQTINVDDFGVPLMESAGWVNGASPEPLPAPEPAAPEPTFLLVNADLPDQAPIEVSEDTAAVLIAAGWEAAEGTPAPDPEPTGVDASVGNEWGDGVPLEPAPEAATGGDADAQAADTSTTSGDQPANTPTTTSEAASVPSSDGGRRGRAGNATDEGSEPASPTEEEKGLR